MGKQPLRIAALCVLVVVGGAIVWINLTAEPAKRQSSDAVEPAAQGILSEFVYTRTQGGAMQWELRAREAEFFQQRNQLTLKQVEGEAVSGARRITVQGERGEVDLEKRSGSLSGNVVGKTNDGYILHTAQLNFDARNKTANTDQAVLLEGPSLTVEAVGMDLDLQNQTFALRERVRASLWREARR